MVDDEQSNPARIRSRTATGFVGCVILVGTAVAGCSSEPSAPIEIGTAKGSGKRITYPAAQDPSGYFAFDQWPAACSFLTTAEVQSVLPQAKKVTHKATDTDISLIPSSRKVTAKNAKCTIHVELPGMSAAILVTEKTAGRNVSSLPASELPSTLGTVDVGDGCTAEQVGTEVSCARGRVTFKLSTPFPYQDREHSNTPKLRYSLAGKIVEFNSEASETRDKMKYEREHISVPLAKLILPKL